MVREFETVYCPLADFFMPETPTAFALDCGPFTLNLYIHPKPDTGKLYIHNPGFANRSDYPYPYYQRIKWLDVINATGISLCDPTIQLSETLGSGWMQGIEGCYYLPYIADAIDKIRETINIPRSNTLLFGASAGGFMAMMLAAHLKGTCAVVDNPQSDVVKFDAPGVRRMLEFSYEGRSPSEVESLFAERVNVTSLFRNVRYVPRLIYVQNTEDHDHMEHQLRPFLHELHQLALDNCCPVENVTIEYYRDPKQKHDPAPYTSMKHYFLQAERKFFDKIA